MWLIGVFHFLELKPGKVQMKLRLQTMKLVLLLNVQSVRISDILLKLRRQKVSGYRTVSMIGSFVMLSQSLTILLTNFTLLEGFSSGFELWLIGFSYLSISEVCFIFMDVHRGFCQLKVS